MLGYIAVAGGVEALTERGAPGRGLRGVVLTGAALLLALPSGVVRRGHPATTAQQRIIEWGVRALIGRSLALSAKSPRETVFLEPLGYIGFYSNLSMRDTPGLCAPDVVALRRQGVLSMPALVAALKTDWVVLRASEYAGFLRGRTSRVRSRLFPGESARRPGHGGRGNLAART